MTSNNSNTSLRGGKKTLSVEYFASLTVALFFALFAIWTLGAHFSTFFAISWNQLSAAAGFLFPVAIWAAYILAAGFAKTYAKRVTRQAIQIAAPKPPAVLVLAISCVATLLATAFEFKFAIISLGAVAIFFLSGREAHAASQDLPPSASCGGAKVFVILLLISVPAVAVVLFANRPDLDDSSFIQIVAQTLAHPDRSPLSFDASLGIVLDRFRFAPYRIASYEILVAFVNDWTQLDIYNVYYLYFPAVSAVLTILTAYLFSRCFLPDNTRAIAAVGMFLIIMFVWGETHYAYGNRVFVRLFQGKGLIVALTTPFTIVVGLMLANRPSYSLALMLIVTNICAIGVSSSGLVMTVFTSITIGVLALGRDYRNTLRSWALTACSMIYPVILAFWLKFYNESAVSLSEVGTYLPINASLGMNVRESVFLCLLLAGYALSVSSRGKSLALAVAAILLFATNPWITQLMSFLTSRNMSWRIAWASPAPLLLSIASIACLTVTIGVNTRTARAMTASIKLGSLFLIILFVFSYRWVLSQENVVTWDWPKPKLESEFHITKKIADKLRGHNSSGQILAHHTVAAWLPLVLPEAGLVMAGHTYPIQLQTILSPGEHNLRMGLYNSINNTISSLPDFVRGLTDLNVEWIIIPTTRKSIIDPLFSYSRTNGFELEESMVIENYSVFRISGLMR